MGRDARSAGVVDLAMGRDARSAGVVDLERGRDARGAGVVDLERGNRQIYMDGRRSRSTLSIAQSWAFFLS